VANSELYKILVKELGRRLMSEMAENRKKMLKELIKQLHAGVASAEVKEKFKQVLEGIGPLEIAKVEEELIKEGMPREEIRRLCDVHLAVLREQIEKQKPEVSPENPVNILMEEHKIMLGLAEELKTIASKVQQASDISHITNDLPHLKHIAKDFLDSEKHYLREENVLFPVLEKHGITEPPAIMWTEHNKIREQKKKLHDTIENCNSISFQDFKKQLSETAQSLGEMLSSHFYKENNILFPAALRVITAEEWKNIRKEFDEIGYCCFTPQPLISVPQAQVGKPKIEVAPTLGGFQFETGSLSKEEMEAVLNTLPVDITFVDKNDTVKYFSANEDRIFVRTKAIIGRKVQMCHPQKSVHIVNAILDAFKKGEKNVAEFWIQMNGRLIYIRYFAVRDKYKNYLGTLEVTQDLTDIKKIEGEKRLLDCKG